MINIAKRIHLFSIILTKEAQKLGYKSNLKLEEIFDTVSISVDSSEKFVKEFEKNEVNVRVMSPTTINLTLNEPTTLYDLEKLLSVFATMKGAKNYSVDFTQYNNEKVQIKHTRINEEFLPQDVFNKFSSETEIMRYMHALRRKDYSLVDGMISLGSCTLKLNSATEMVINHLICVDPCYMAPVFKYSSV